MVERCPRLFLKPKTKRRVIYEVSTDTRSVEHDWDAVAGKLRSWTDSRKH
jgi:hypothetical protein